jgi:hypothetical protein
MNANTKESIQQEIRRRAFERFDDLQEEKVNLQNSRYTLDALQEVTGLPRVELETIAQEVRNSFATYQENFFSIKNQMIWVFGSLGVFAFLTWLIMTLY